MSHSGHANNDRFSSGNGVGVDLSSSELGIWTRGERRAPIDPAGIAASDPSNPQSWNRYSYVVNSPLTGTDLYGLYCVPGSCPGDSPMNFPGAATGYFGETLLAFGFLNGHIWGKEDDLCFHCNSVPGKQPKPNKPQQNIYYLQLKVFFSGFGQTVLSEFKAGGCFNQFVHDAFDPTTEIGGRHAAIKSATQSGAYTAATAYAVKQGLTVPMRSSTVRAILGIGEVAGEVVALGLNDVEEAKAIVNEGISYAQGECH